MLSAPDQEEPDVPADDIRSRHEVNLETIAADLERADDPSPIFTEVQRCGADIDMGDAMAEKTRHPE